MDLCFEFTDLRVLVEQRLNPWRDQPGGKIHRDLDIPFLLVRLGKEQC